MKNLPLLWILLFSLLGGQAALADPVPHLISYQGRLTGTDGAPLATADYSLSFKIYDQAIGGNLLWGPQSFTQVPVAQGHFSVILGQFDEHDAPRDIAAAFNTPDAYLEISVNGDSPISPRQKVLSAPYALYAQVSNTVRGEEIYVHPDTHKVGIGTITPNEKLTVNGTISALGINFPDNKRIPPADFETDWFLMKSQSGTDAYKEIFHNLESYPSQVKVLVKAIDGNNAGFIFEGLGSAQNDDDGDKSQYGGVIFAYDENRIRLWAPDKNNESNQGRIIFIEDGWGGETNSELI